MTGKRVELVMLTWAQMNRPMSRILKRLKNVLVGVSPSQCFQATESTVLFHLNPIPYFLRVPTISQKYTFPQE